MLHRITAESLTISLALVKSLKLTDDNSSSPCMLFNYEVKMLVNAPHFLDAMGH